MFKPSTINPSTLPSLPLEQKSQLPKTPCIYFAIDSAGVVQYIGKSVNLKVRWVAHHRYSQLVEMDAVRIAYFPIDADLLLEVEAALVEWFKPPLNGWQDTSITRSPKKAVAKNKISVYLSDELRADVDRLSELNKRSLSNLIDVLLQEAVDKARQEGKL